MAVIGGGFEFFEQINDINNEVLSGVQGIDENSKLYFSSKSNLIPLVEIREALQEDHDDLAAVFNAQSEVLTETFGEYFLAELIAAQNDENKALVAQVGDKAIGLLALSSEIDVSVLDECFNLNQYDKLLKSDFVNMLEEKREQIRNDRIQYANQQKELHKKRCHEEYMKCHILTIKTQLQQFLNNNSEEIIKT